MTPARIERKHARQGQRAGRVLKKRFKSGPENLVAYENVLKRGVAMQMKAWSIKRRAGTLVAADEQFTS